MQDIIIIQSNLIESEVSAEIGYLYQVKFLIWWYCEDFY